MKTFYVRLKSLSNLAREQQEIKAIDGYAAFIAAPNAAANWGAANGSEEVRWWVEEISGREIGNGTTKLAPPAKGLATQAREAFEAAKSLKAKCDAEVAAGRSRLVGPSFVGTAGDGYSDEVPADKGLCREFDAAQERLVALLDRLVDENTGFAGTFCDLLEAQRTNGYRPTFREFGHPAVSVLADCYDYFAVAWGLAETSYRPESEEKVRRLFELHFEN